jgi:predicted RNA-binding Zn-ribbon protein involved in translation (DUF1610 family)
MPAPSIKSRPVYPGLQITPARRHLFVLEGEGALAFSQCIGARGGTCPVAADILYVAAASQPRGHADMLRQLGPRDLWQAPSVPTLLNRFRAMLSSATMGTKLYIAGTEGFIGQAMHVAMDFGVDPASICTEHRGSLARRVQCVHCKGITEAVTTSPYTCAHCGLALFVRDHYSRRIGAFQGVNIDAEAPGEIPSREELYP